MLGGSWLSCAHFRSRLSGVSALVLAFVVSVTAVSIPAPAAAAGSTCSKPGSSLTKAIAVAKSCRVRVEAADRTTATEQVFANPDGTMTLEQHMVPVRVRRDSGWVPVDHTLVKRPDGWVVPKASAVDVRFSGGGKAALASLSPGQRRSVSVSWPESLPSPILNGDTATYPEVLPGVDLQVQATDDGFKHVLVVKTAAAAANPKVRKIDYGFSAVGLTLRRTAQGGMEAVDKTGYVLATAPPATAWDSKNTGPTALKALAGVRVPANAKAEAQRAGVESSRSGPGEFAQVAPVAVALDGAKMTVTPDSTLLDKPDHLPIYIDPPFTGGLQAWAYSNSSNENNSDGRAWIGVNPATGALYRSFFQVDMGRVVGANIISARFDITMVHSYSCGPTPMTLWWTSTIPNTSGGRAAWSPGLIQSMDTQSGNAHKVSGGVPVCNPDPQPDMSMHFNGALTGKVQDWANEGVRSVTLGLAAGDGNNANESATLRWKKFNASTAQIVIHYNNLPVIPKQDSVTPCYAYCANDAYTRSLTPTLAATVSDVDGDVLRAEFEVWAGSGADAYRLTGGSVTATSGGTPRWQVTPALADNTYYWWRVRACDDVKPSNACGGWSGWWLLRTQAHNPNSPQVLTNIYSPTEWKGGIGVPDDFMWYDPAAWDYQFVYSFDNATPVTVPGWTTKPDGSREDPFTPWAPTVDGVHSVTVYSRNEAGNTSYPPTVFQFKVAPPAPEAGSFALDETTGDTAANRIDSTNNGTRYGGTTWIPNGSRAGAASFDGTGAIDTARAVLSTTNAAGYTVAAWVRLSSLPTVNRTILSQDGAVGSAFQLQYVAAVNAFCFTQKSADSTTATPTSACATTTPARDDWIHVAGVYDAPRRTIRLYVGGTQVAETAYTATWSAAGRFTIGRALQNGSAADRWVGGVDEVRAFQRVLTDDELFQLSIRDAR
jgi:hypothetical protein